MTDLNLESIMKQNLDLKYEIKIPILMNKGKMCTINNWATTFWATKSKLKNQYKELLSNWFLSNKKISENSIFLWKPIYKDRRKRDALNLAKQHIGQNKLIEFREHLNI